MNTNIDIKIIEVIDDVICNTVDVKTCNETWFASYVVLCRVTFNLTGEFLREL